MSSTSTSNKMSTMYVSRKDRNADAFHIELRLLIKEIQLELVPHFDDFEPIEDMLDESRDTVTAVFVSSKFWCEQALWCIEYRYAVYLVNIITNAVCIKNETIALPWLKKPFCHSIVRMCDRKLDIKPFRSRNSPKRKM